MSTVKRIAILGFSLEANRNAPVSDKKSFQQTLYLQGATFEAELAGDRVSLPGTVRGFCATLDQSISWIAVPIVLAEAPPGGPVEQTFFEQLLAQMRQGLEQATKHPDGLDGVYISEHGAGLAEHTDDADGEVFSMVRDVVGTNVPIIATLDLHGHVTTRMNESTDVMVAYLTNPHVDQFERGTEAAHIMMQMHLGMRPRSVLVRVPMVCPAVSLLTANGPFAELVAYGQSRLDDNVVNVSILPGFAPADASTNAMSIVVTTRGDSALAQELANDIANRAWADRKRYVANLTPLQEAIIQAATVVDSPDQRPLLLADVADNPGAGGRGNTVYILRELLRRQVHNVVIGMMYDEALAAQAHTQNIGDSFHAHFNRDETTRFSESLNVDVEVEALADGTCIGRRGIYADRRVDLGPCALLRVAGIRIAVVSRRHQCADPVFLERMGIDLKLVRILVIKSRGHFRAGFDEYFSDDQIVEVDAPGLTTPVIPNLNLVRVARPIYPLDPDMNWAP
ncbi:MAG: M81 family metallopeptidase [Granulosicoccus sp.]